MLKDSNPGILMRHTTSRNGKREIQEMLAVARTCSEMFVLSRMCEHRTTAGEV